MEQIGKQVTLPLATAMQITLQGIRIRLGRSLVTISSVVLGIAFLMSVVTGELVKSGVSAQQEKQQRLNLMTTLVKQQVGDVAKKTVGIAIFGTLSEPEQALITQLKRNKANLRSYGEGGAGTKVQSPEQAGDDADLLLVLGDATKVPVSLDILTKGMPSDRVKIVLDSIRNRFTDAAGITGLTYEPFFGEQSQEAIAAAKEKAKNDQARTVWIVAISLLVTVIGIANALLMSVTERFKEIGTMKCLGALSSFIRQLFLIESALVGLAGSLAGMLIGVLLPLLVNSLSLEDGFAIVFGGLNYGLMTIACVACLVTGTLLSILAAIYPANFAAKMVPASALRSNV